MKLKLIEFGIYDCNCYLKNESRQSQKLKNYLIWGNQFKMAYKVIECKISKSNKIRFKKSVKMALLNGGEEVLDLGCGYGQLKAFLPEVKYTGVDLSNSDDCIKWNLEKGLPLKIKKQKFDVIFMLELLEHIENFKTLLKECKKLLRKEGRIIISTPTPHAIVLKEPPSHIHCFKPNEMENLAKIVGLKVVEKSGSSISIPKLHNFLPWKFKFFTNTVIYRLEIEPA